MKDAAVVQAVSEPVAQHRQAGGGQFLPAAVGNQAMQALARMPMTHAQAQVLARRIRYQVALPPPRFVYQGRLPGHDSAANQRALTAKISARAPATAAVAPGPAPGPAATSARNNPYEQQLFAGAPAPPAANFVRGRLKPAQLAICHKMSSEEVQEAVANAATALAGPPANLAAAVNALTQLIAAVQMPAIDPLNVAGTPYANAYAARINYHAQQATNVVNALQVMHAAGTPPAQWEPLLNNLAGLIANSPGNLFIGAQLINASIQSRGDFNAVEDPPAPPVGGVRQRRLTPSSEQLYQTILPLIANATLPADLTPVSVHEGLTFGWPTRRRQWAANVPGPHPPAAPPMVGAAAGPAPAHGFHMSSSALSPGAGGYPGYVGLL